MVWGSGSSSSTIIRLPNKSLSKTRKSPHSTPLFFSRGPQWKWPLHREKQTLLTEAWAEHDSEASPHCASLHRSGRSDTETKAHRPSTGRGLKCLALRYGLAECVCGHRALLYSALCGRGSAVFSMRGSAGAPAQTTFYQWNHLLKVMFSDGHLNPASPYLDCIASESSSFLFFFFLAGSSRFVPSKRTHEVKPGRRQTKWNHTVKVCFTKGDMWR